MPSPPEPNTPRPTPARSVQEFAERQEAERLLTRATIQFRRGVTADAEAAVRELLAQRPQDAGAHELMADILQSRGDLVGAQDALRSALAAEPGRPSAETKLARIALQVAERKYIQQMGMSSLSPGLSLQDAMPRGRLWSVIATIFLPGLGQYLNGEAVKGIILGAIYFFAFFLLSHLPSTQNLLRQIAEPGHSQPVGFVTWFLLLLLAGDWIYAVIDIARAAKPRAMPSDKDGWQV